MTLLPGNIRDYRFLAHFPPRQIGPELPKNPEDDRIPSLKLWCLPHTWLEGAAMLSEMDFSVDPGTIIGVLVVLVLYFVFLVRALVEMIRLDAPTVMIVFTYISLIPFPLLLILGILNLIIWHLVRKDLIAARDLGS
jgi:hypothetical protein